MADWGSEFRFLRDIHVRLDIRIDIFISIRPMNTKFDKQTHLHYSNETIQIGAGNLIMSRSN